jgi:hypothetical protein
MSSSAAITRFPIVASRDTTIPKIEGSAGNAFGRTVRKIWHGVESGADHFFRCAAAVKDDPTSLTQVLRCVGTTLTNIKNSEGLQRFGSKLTFRLGDAVTFIDGMQILGDIHYFFNREYKTKRHKGFCVAGHVAFAVGDVGSCLLWLEQMGFKLSRAVQSVGNMRVFNVQPFKFLPKIPLGTIVSGAFFGGFVLMGADAVHRLVDPKLANQKYKHEKQIKAGLDLAYNVFAAAGIVFGWVGVTSLPVLIGLGALSMGFGVASFLYGVYKDKQLANEDDDLLLR